MNPVGIQLSSAVSTLRQVSDQQLKALLCSDRITLVQSQEYLKDQKVWVGKCEIPELTLDKFPYFSRQLQLAFHALLPIESDLKQLTLGLDLSKLAIVLGTTTSTIIETAECPEDIHIKSESQNSMGNIASVVQDYLGWTGAAYTISTACTSSAKALATAQRLLNTDCAEVVLVGGVDVLCPYVLNGFESLASLCPGLCTPCGEGRHGINIGEAASWFVLTKDQAPVMLLASGESTDAWHIASPHPEGIGAVKAMKDALNLANLSYQQIDYINLHGTATPQNDAMEIKAISQVFDSANLWISSTKHKTGHCLGASGAIEAYICQKILTDNEPWLPWHHAYPLDENLEKFNYVRPQSDIGQVDYIMSNSFAFGGSNISLIFARGVA